MQPDDELKPPDEVWLLEVRPPDRPASWSGAGETITPARVK